MVQITASSAQKQNPLVEFLTQVSYTEEIFDYRIGKFTFLFISVKYHQVNPSYFEMRIEKGIPTHLLLVVDTESQSDVRRLNTLAVTFGIILILAFSYKEASQYLSTFATSHDKQLDTTGGVHIDKSAFNCLLNVKGVNTTDVIVLADRFKSFRALLKATKKEIEECPGFGELKAKRLLKSFDQPFVARKKIVEIYTIKGC